MGAPVDWQGENGCTPLRRARAEGYRGVATGLVNELVWSLCDLDNWIKTAAKKTKARAGGNKRQGVFNYNPLARGRHLLVEFLVNKAQREQVRARRATTRFPVAATGATPMARSVRSLALRLRANYATHLVL